MDPSFLMRQMQMKPFEAEEIYIKKGDEFYIIKNPEIMEMNLMGQKVLVISNPKMEKADICNENNNINEEDVDFLVEQLNISKDKAKELLKKSKGDIALAISLYEKENNKK